MSKVSRELALLRATMASDVQLVDFEAPDGDPVRVDVNDVSMLEKRGANNTRITLKNGKNVVVAGTVEEVTDKLKA